jgi:hypothetical protein
MTTKFDNRSQTNWSVVVSPLLARSVLNHLFQLLDNGNLLVPPKMPGSESHIMLYQCVAENDNGSDSKVIMLYATRP